MYDYEFDRQCIIDELNEAEDSAEFFYEYNAKRLDTYLSDSDILTGEYIG